MNNITAEQFIEFLFDKSTEAEMRKMIRNLSTRHAQLQDYFTQSQSGITSVYKSLSADIRELKEAIIVLSNKIDSKE